MKPIGPLMREHRLIERMVKIFSQQYQFATEDRKIDIGVLVAGIDFFHTYADEGHHGKEEDILFRELDKKPLSPEHRRIMEELIAEHARVRQMVAGLRDAARRYVTTDDESLDSITGFMKDLTAIYPPHIAKEDKNFFFPILTYLTKAEQDSMLQEFWEFDRQLIHEKYQQVVQEIESGDV